MKNNLMETPPWAGHQPSGRSPKRQRTSSDNTCLRITTDVFNQIRDSIASSPAERGGALGGSHDDGVVRVFRFDDTAACSTTTYSPDHETLNRLLREEWNPRGINFLGFAHSHPSGFNRPSGGDLAYGRAILKAIPELDRLLLPIVATVPDSGEFEFLAFAVVRDANGGHVEPLELEILGQKKARSKARPPFSFDEAFTRVKDAYDLDRLRRSRVNLIGVGGAAAFATDLARAGVGQFVLIDPDVVSASNLATQQVFVRDIGRPKVLVLARQIREINPDAVVVAQQKRLDEIDDRAFQRLAFDPIKGHIPFETLLCGLTDNFEAQARVNRLALQFGMPSLCAQVYREGRGAEISFTYPGVTPACHRCILSSRYRAYLEDGFQNDVTSNGTPIFATTRLNALKGFIAMALLHHGSSHPRWGTLLERIKDRNLVQLRMDPDIQSSLGLGVFERVFGGGDTARIFFDEAVWLPQKPECPENGQVVCPDCGGSGNLRRAKCRFTDTRIITA